MTTVLPYSTNLLPPKWRILHTSSWYGTWIALPTATVHGGFHVEELWRSVIPEPGQATFKYDFGNIDGKTYGVDTTTVTGPVQYVDLAGHFVRIQCAPDPGAGQTPAWATVFLGIVEHQEDVFRPGDGIGNGTRHYHCLDLLSSITKRQPMDRHGAYLNGNFYVNAYGHPGYNAPGWDGRVLGNRERSGTTWASSGKPLPWDNDSLSVADKASFNGKLFCHTWPGANPGSGAVWTDLQAVEHALCATRVPFNPFFYCVGATGLLASGNAWPIKPGMMVWDYLTQIFRRERGRGLAALDWTESGDQSITPFVRVWPQTLTDVTSTSPIDGTVTTFPGATSAGTTNALVDLIGDHRNISSTFALGDQFQHTYNYVESFGDPIEVLATIDKNSGALANRWDSSEETAFSGADIMAKRTSRYNAVWQLFGLNSGWTGLVGPGGTSATDSSYTRCDYRCSDAGAIVVPTGSPDTSPLLVRVMSDLPLYVGYDYSGATPVRFDGQTEYLCPQRMPVIALWNITADKWVYLHEQMHFGLTISDYGILLSRDGDMANGVRYLSTTAGLTLKVAISVGLQLPHRVRMATGDPLGKRRKVLYFRGLNLWLAHYNAIWDFSQTGNPADNSAWTVRRAAGLSTKAAPGVLRDDRDRLAQYHALASNWYLNQRRTATWQLRACGVLPSFDTVTTDGTETVTAVAYPTLGQLVTDLNACGLAYAINTPITKIHYTQRSNGVTTWQTDWSDLDLR